MNNWRTYGGVAVLFSLLLVIPLSGMAQEGGKGKAGEGPVVEAKEYFKKGVAFFKAGDYEAALVEFVESNRLNPHWSLKYNIATCYMLIFEYAKSLKIFREYMKEGGEAVPADRKKIVLKNMASLKAKVGMVTVNCNVQGASLIVDEVEKHETIPPEGVIFDPGIYKIKVAKVGYEPFVVQVNVVSGGNTSLDVNLKKIEGHVSIEPEEQPENGGIPEEPEEEPAKPRPKKKLANSYKWLIGGLVSGGLIAIGAVATGVVGQNEQNAMEDEAAKCPSTAERQDCPEAYLHQDKAGDLQLGTNVLIAGAAAAGALGLIMFFVEWNKEKKLKAGEDLEDSVNATIMLYPGRMIGAGMELRF